MVRMDLVLRLSTERREYCSARETKASRTPGICTSTSLERRERTAFPTRVVSTFNSTLFTYFWDLSPLILETTKPMTRRILASFISSSFNTSFQLEPKCSRIPVSKFFSIWKYWSNVFLCSIAPQGKLWSLVELINPLHLIIHECQMISKCLQRYITSIYRNIYIHIISIYVNTEHHPWYPNINDIWIFLISKYPWYPNTHDFSISMNHDIWISKKSDQWNNFSKFSISKTQFNLLLVKWLNKILLKSCNYGTVYNYFVHSSGGVFKCFFTEFYYWLSYKFLATKNKLLQLAMWCT